MKKTLISLTVFLLCNVASADDFAAVEAKLKAAMASDVRTEREIARDRNRMPVETLRFFGLRDDMRIIELIPGGGWYTKLLAPVMAAKGEYFAALDVGRIEELIAGNPGFQGHSGCENIPSCRVTPLCTGIRRPWRRERRHGADIPQLP